MKALFNPETNMVLSWSAAKASMSHLEEIEISDKSEINQPRVKEVKGETVVEKPAPKKKATKKKKQGFPVAGEDEKYAGNAKSDPEPEPEPVAEDDFNVDDL